MACRLAAFTAGAGRAEQAAASSSRPPSCCGCPSARYSSCLKPRVLFDAVFFFVLCFGWLVCVCVCRVAAVASSQQPESIELPVSLSGACEVFTAFAAHSGVPFNTRFLILFTV